MIHAEEKNIVHFFHVLVVVIYRHISKILDWYYFISRSIGDNRQRYTLYIASYRYIE